MDDTVNVKIGAQVTDLQAKIALAKSELASLNSSVKTHADAMTQLGAQADAGLNRELQALTSGAARAKSSLSSLEGELKKIQPAASGMHGSISTATREFRALFDELSSGRTRMTPGTLAIIAQRVFGLSGATIVAAGGVLALVGAFGALAYSAAEASEEMGKIKLAGDFAGGLQESKQQVMDLVNTLASLPGVSRQAAEETVDAFVKIGVTAKPELDGLSEAATRYALVFGGTGAEAAKRFSTILDQSKTSATELQKVFPGLTDAEIREFQSIQKLGDQHRTAAELMTITADRSRYLDQEWSDNVSSITRLTSNFGIYLGSLQGVRSMEEGHEAVIATNTSLYNAQSDAIWGNVNALKALPANTGAQFSKDMDAASHSTAARMDELRDSIKRVKTYLADPAETDKEKENFRSMVADNERELKTLGDRGKESFSKATGFSNVGAEQIAQARETISVINANDKLGATEREQQETQVWDSVLATAKLKAAQRIEVEKAKNDAIAEANRRNAQEQQQIDRSNSDTELELARIAFQEKKDELEREVAAHQISKQEELAQEIKATQDMGDAEQQALTASEKGYATDSTFFIETENKKKIAAAQTQQEVDKLRAEMVRQSQADAQADARSWTMAANEITGAERTMTDDLLSDRKGLLGALEDATSQFIRKEIADDLAYYTKKELLSKEDFAADQAREQGGLLVHMLSETEKTTSTVTGEAVRTAASRAGSLSREAATNSETASENAGFLARAGKWIASELGMTEATTTGAAERETATTAAVTAGKTAEAALNAASAESYAAIAATGAAAAVAWIPIAGPELAATMAASTFASLQPYVGIASLDVGAWNVPRDMPANIHKGEMVVPANFAEGLRGSASAPAHGVGGGSTTNVFNHSPNVQGGSQSLEDMLENQGHALKSWFNRQVRSGALRV